MIHIEIEHLLQHRFCFDFLAFGNRILIYIVKHEKAQVAKCLRGLIRHNDVILAHTMDDDIMNQMIQTRSRVKTERLAKLERDIILAEYLRTDCVINVRIHVRNLIRQAHNLAL